MSDFLGNLRQAQDGNEPALEKLMRQFAWVVDAECRRALLASPTELSSSDFGQEIWLKIWANLRRFEINESDHVQQQFAQWLRVVSRRVIVGLIEKQNAKRRNPRTALLSLDEVEVEDDVKTASSIVNDEHQRQRLLAAVHSLPTDEMKKIIEMRFFGNLSMRQIADQLRISEDQVRYRFHAALRRLEQRLTDF